MQPLEQPHNQGSIMIVDDNPANLKRLEETVQLRTRELAEAKARLTILDGSKNDFLHLISHEFRTPLHGILGVTDIIFDEVPSSDLNNSLRDAFDQSRKRILSLLEDG